MGFIWQEVIDGLGVGEHVSTMLYFWELNLAAVHMDGKGKGGETNWGPEKM